MTLTQLEYIVAVEGNRHFAIAASKCNVTQPTLSIQIQKLENELGIMLFDRTKHPVVPTEEGKVLVEQAKQVLKAAQKLRGLALTVRDEVRGNLRIAILPSLAPYLLPLFLVPFSNKYPEVKVELRELHNYQLFKRLQQDTTDAAITISPIGMDGFYEIPVFKEPIAVFLHPNHPLAKKQQLRVKDIPLNELILTEDTRSMANVIAELQGKALEKDTAKNIKYKSSSVETIRRIVERQGGITLLPKLATIYMDESHKQYVRYFEDPQPTRQVILLVQRGFQKQRLIDVLREEIIATLPKMP